MRLFPILRIAACLSLASLTAHAQNIAVKFKVFDLAGDDMPKSVNFKQGDKFTPITLSPFVMLPGLYNYSGPAEMALYGSDIGPKATPIGKITFPGSGSYTLMVAAAGGGTVAGIALPDAAFAMGSIRFVNVTGLPITVSVNDKKTSLAAGGHEVVAGGDMPSATIRIYANRNDKLEEVANNILPTGKTFRRVVVVTLTNAQAMKANPATMPNCNMLTYTEAGGK